MKLVHVVPHIDQEAAGPSYSVPRLCQSLAQCDNEVELCCLAARGDIPSVKLELHYQWPVLKRFAISSSLATALRRKAAIVDVIHNHSLWSMANVAAGWAVPGRGAKLVTSPRGTLSAWALDRNAQLKRLMWPMQRRALTRADMLHATSAVEYREIRALGFTAPVALIPNGIDLPPMTTQTRRTANRDRRTLLFLSRIHPTKGLDRLLHAWRRLQCDHPDWRLVVAGRGESAHVQEVQALAHALKLQSVEFPGALYGAAKSRAYWDADLFVLPTHSENFGMVVAEALAHCCPAVVSQGAPWPGLQTEGCGWWVANDIDTLAATLDATMKMPVEGLAAMGLRGRSWMERDFGWTTVGQKMDRAYRWLLGNAAKPEWIA